MNPKILNREGRLPEDGWYNIEALGEHINHDFKVVQVVDEKAVTSILNRFSAEAREAGADFPGTPLDRDHLSDSLDNTTEAYGWGMQLRKSAHGYDAKIDWTPIGEPLVTKQGDKPPAYKFFSTGYESTDCEKIGTRKIGKKTYDVVRPLRLASISLTNQPNNKGQRPISNRNGISAGADENETEPTMKNVMKLLGLAEDASEASATEAIQKIQNRATKAEGDLTALQSEHKVLLDVQVESDLEKYKNRYKPENREKLKKQLIANRASTVELLESIEPGETKPARFTNRSGATPPAGERHSPAGGGGGEEDEAKLARKITNRANELKGLAPTRTFNSCWQQAQSENADAAAN